MSIRELSKVLASSVFVRLTGLLPQRHRSAAASTLVPVAPRPPRPAQPGVFGLLSGGVDHWNR
jgi:hypothetical protein